MRKTEVRSQKAESTKQKSESRKHKAQSRRLSLAVLLCAIYCLLPAAYRLLPSASASDPGSGDWPMWGGTPDRNMVSPMKGIPTSWDVASKKNVKWVAGLGSQSYGNPVVAG